MIPHWLRFVATTAPVDLPMLAVFVHHPEPDHCGVIYASTQGERYALHLAWHKQLRRDEVQSSPMLKYAWIAPTLPRERALAVVAMCSQVWRRHRELGLPYGLRYDATTFARGGAVRFGPDEVGFTCATFVLVLFGACRVRLLRSEEWRGRDDDRPRQHALVNLLRGDPEVPRAHCDAIEWEVGAVRFRPTEVAGACAASALPCSFVDAATHAGRIVEVFAARSAR